ncbi:MAG: OmpA family protein [Bacteroidales bacterium]|nr:OmpA family protein [Bacteroidales bacterium]
MMKLYYILIILCQILIAPSIYANETEINDGSLNQDPTTIKSCIDCHSNLIKKNIHAPAEESCENCHISNDNDHPEGAAKGFSLADDVPTLCFYCHEEYSKKNKHAPAEAGECAMCHNSHSSDYPKLLNESRTDKLCFECHDLEIPEINIVHAPVEEGACDECHDSHQSDNSSFLKATSPQLCFNCHETAKEQTQKRNVHAPFEDDCFNCHQSHSSAEKGLLTEKTPTLCFNCHEGYTKKNIHAPAESGECSICHNSHSSDYPKLLNESRTDKLCFECHDLEIPETNIVHAPVQEGACDDCHDSHQSDNSSFLKATSPQLCYNCHETVKEQTQKRNIHAPFADDCANCHQAHSSTEKALLTEKTPTLCINCHEGYTKKNKHAPAESGECSICHNSHSSDYPKLLNESSTDKLCFECHDLGITETQNVHGPVQEGACDECHDSHQSDNSAFLKLASPQLCFNCHGEYTKKNIHAPAESGECAMCHNSHSSDYPKLLRDSRTDKLCYECHDLEIPETNIVHAPVKEGACDDCHDSHQSDNRSFLKATGSQLCFNCHETAKDQAQQRRLHAPFEDDCSNCHQAHSAAEKGLIAEKTPTLCYNCHGDVQELIVSSKFVHNPMNDQESCSNCHSPHGSSENAILLETEKELCLSCHSKTYTSESGKTKNIKQKLKSGNNIHAPVDEGCVICHKPHASNNQAILNSNFPSGNYAEASAENFALCFECHDSDLMLSEFTTDATNFRDGNVNMHYVHINGTKGISCKMCHDSHATKGKFLIIDKVPFGKWEMDMNFVEKELGGSCATGCHAEKEYNRYIESALAIEDSVASDSIIVVPKKRYQNYTEHVQSIDLAVVEYNENVDKQMAEKQDSLDQILLAQNLENTDDIKDEIQTENIDDVVKTELVALKEIEENISADTITTKEEITLNEPIKEEVHESSELENVQIIGMDTVVDKLVSENIPPVEVTEKEISPDKSLKNENDTELKIETIDERADGIEFPIIYFAFSKSEIDNEGEEGVKMVSGYLKKNSDIRIELQGYSDSIGNAQYNLKLSKLRANKVKDLLVKNGVEISRIKVKGFGENKAQLPNRNSEDRTEDRRVEFVLLDEEN